MKQMISALEYQKKVNQAYLEEAQEYQKLDLDNLNKAAAELFGEKIQFKTDNIGNLINYDEIMSAADKALEELYNEYAIGGWTDDEVDYYNEAKEKLERIQALVDQYDATTDIIDTALIENEKIQQQIQDYNYDIITLELELKLEVAEIDMSNVDRALAKLDNDLFSRAEAWTLRTSLIDDDTLSQLEILKSAGTDLNTAMTELKNAYDADNISASAYHEGLQKLSQESLSYLDIVENLKNSMGEYYSETLAMSQEEIAKYTNLLENNSAVLEHYITLTELMGESLDFKKIGVILKGQAQIAEDSLAVSSRTKHTFII